MSRLVLLLLLAAVVWWLFRRALTVRMGDAGARADDAHSRDRANGADQSDRRDRAGGAGGAGRAGRANASFDPYRVLGIARGASPEEIRRAYRDQLRHYHPDRVADLGEELREVAHRRTLEIQRAYELLRAP